jgi:serine protease Do
MSRTVHGLSFGLVAGLAALLGLLAGGNGSIPEQPGKAETVVRVGGSFADVIDRVNPAVVHVTVVENSSAGGRDGADRESPRRGEGSGFIVDPDGYILTNHHVVATPARIRVRLADKTELPAALVGSDSNTDLALLKVSAPKPLPVVPLGDSDRLRVGDWVFAIGNPYRLEHSVTAGVVSSKGRKIYDASFDSYIQTDAAINPGNSGGPLINTSGEAIGINSAVSTQGQGIGFAVPINVARDILDQLRSHGRVTRGYLGIQLQELDPDLQRLIGIPASQGAVVIDVVDGEPGEAAGLKRYDVITALGAQPIEDGDHLVRAIASKAPGSSVTLKVFRDGKYLNLRARLAEREAQEAVGEVTVEPADNVPPPEGDELGLVVGELNRKMKATLGIPLFRSGVLVDDIVSLSPDADALTHGDVIMEVNREPVPDVAAYRKVVAGLKPGDLALLIVYRPRPISTFLAKVEVEGRK